ncbi:hypothetical protein D7252_07440 [Microbacterium sp. CGR2]|nr:hypothetical protein D7252_07440 [Microbacterium sp. CGR2]
MPFSAPEDAPDSARSITGAGPAFPASGLSSPASSSALTAAARTMPLCTGRAASPATPSTVISTRVAPPTKRSLQVVTSAPDSSRDSVSVLTRAATPPRRAIRMSVPSATAATNGGSAANDPPVPAVSTSITAARVFCSGIRAHSRATTSPGTSGGSATRAPGITIRYHCPGR